MTLAPIIRLLWHTDMLATRFTLAIAAISGGLMILLSDSDSWPSHTLIDSDVAGLLFVLQGLVMLRTITAGWSMMTPALQRVGIAIDGITGCFLWTGVAAYALMDGALTIGDASILSLACASWWSLVRWSDHYDGI